jgi:hypothetical protein
MTSVFVIIFMTYYIYLSITIYILTRRLGPQNGIHDLPEFSKIFWLPIVSAFSLFAFKRQLKNASIPIFLLICKDQENTEKLKDRADKAAVALYKWVYYTGSSISGYYILKDTEILPWYLGGVGSL